MYWPVIRVKLKMKSLSEELDTTHLNTTIEVSPPILDSSANPKQNFFEKYAETAWTNGVDTIVFKPFTDEIKDWGDVIGPKMWYFYKVDGPFYVLPLRRLLYRQ